MPTYIREVEDSRGDLVDIHYFCSEGCYRDSFAADRIGSKASEGGASPCAESDSEDADVHCAECGVLMHSAAGLPTPVVVNLIKRPPINPATGAAMPL